MAHEWSWYISHRIHVCYIIMVTFTMNIPQMLAYIPYMDTMGYNISRQCKSSIFKRIQLEESSTKQELSNWVVCFLLRLVIQTIPSTMAVFLWCENQGVRVNWQIPWFWGVSMSWFLHECDNHLWLMTSKLLACDQLEMLNASKCVMPTWLVKWISWGLTPQQMDVRYYTQ